MRQKISIILLIFIILSCSNKDKYEENLTIKGQIKGLRLGNLLIKQMIKDSLIAIDSIKIDGKEHFEFHTNINEPQIMLLELPEVKEGRISFFAAPNDTIKIFTYVESFALTPHIKGGPNQKQLNIFNKMMKLFANKEIDLFKAQFDASKMNLLSKADSLKNTLNRLQQKRQLYMLNFIFQNKNKAIGSYIAMMNFYNNPKILDTIYKILPNKQKNSLYAKEIKKIIDNSIQ